LEAEREERGRPGGGQHGELVRCLAKSSFVLTWSTAAVEWYFERCRLANRTTVKIGPAIDAKLYKEFVAVAKENGQSQRFLLEKAIEHYIHTVVPSQHTVRPEVMEAFRRSNEKFQELYRKLAE